MEGSEVLSFESPDVERQFPGLFERHSDSIEDVDEDVEHQRKKDVGKKKDVRKEGKDKGYHKFEQEDSDEEPMISSEEPKNLQKLKKHSRPSFKITKKEKQVKVKEKTDKKENKKEEKGETKDKSSKNKKKPKKNFRLFHPEPLVSKDKVQIFGVLLPLAVERSNCYDGIQLPTIVRESIDYIEQFGLTSEGIYRISGVKSKVQSLREAYNHGQSVDLNEYEPNIVASLLKLYLRELPEPILTSNLMPKFENVAALKNPRQLIEEMQGLIESLPLPNRLLLSWMIIHMTHVIAHESQNKMSLQNVSIVLSPTMRISHRVLSILFTHAKILFKDTVIKKYVPPLRSVSSRWSLELPETPTAIEEEIKKQELLLSDLHEQLMNSSVSTSTLSSNKNDPSEVEEMLWEAQRIHTQLKRKLKSVKRAQEAAIAAEKRDQELVRENIDKIHQLTQQRLQLQQARSTPTKTTPTKTTPTKAIPPKTVSKSPSPTKTDDKSEPTTEPKNLAESTENIERVEPTDSSTNQSEIKTNSFIEKTNESLSKTDIKEQIVEKEKQDIEKLVTDESSSIEDPDANNILSQSNNTGAEDSDIDTQCKSSNDLKVSNLAVSCVDECGENKDKETLNSESLLDDEEKQEVSNEEEDKQELSNEEEDKQELSNEEEEKQEAPVTEDEEEEEELTDEELLLLLHDQMVLALEEEELRNIGAELRQKIDAEREEIERLQQEINEVKSMREDMDTSSSSNLTSSEDETSGEEENEEELAEILRQLKMENYLLEKSNAELSEKIHAETSICLDVKIKIRMLQQQQQIMSNSFTAEPYQTLAASNDKDNLPLT